MNSSITKMWLSCLLATSMISLAIAAGNEYLPPKNGYHYDAPPIEFTTPNRVPRPTPPIPTYRPTPPIPTYRPAPPTRPPYLPPPTPGPRPPQPPPSPPHPPTPHHDEHDHSHDHDHHHHEPGMPFDFAYAVNEDGNDYSHNAVSDGDVTRGEYRVALPDGRTQIVKYTADWKNGFNAEVTYEGQARYPDQPINGYGSGNTGGQSYVPPNQGGGYQY